MTYAEWRSHSIPISLNGDSASGSGLFYDKPFSIALRVFRDDELVHESTSSFDPKSLTRTVESYHWSQDTETEIDLSNVSELTLFAKVQSAQSASSPIEPQQFKKTFQIVDLAPWTAVLREERISFGERLEQFQKSLLELDPDFDELLGIEHVELPHQEAVDRTRAKFGIEFPPMMEAFVTRTVSLDQLLFAGPAAAYANTIKTNYHRWLTLAEFESHVLGIPHDDVFSRGEQYTEFATRYIALFNFFGDGPTTTVWNPFADENEAAFFEVEADTRELTELRDFRDKPLTMLDVMLGALDWSLDWKEGRWDYPDSWVSVAVRRTLPSVDLDHVLVVDSSNPKGVLSIILDGETREPTVFFDGRTWGSEYVIFT